MDPIALTTLASQVMALLTPYLTKAGEEFVSQFGDAAFEQCKRLYDAVRARFIKEAPKDGGNAAQALDALAKDPDMASAVQTKLVRILQEDPDFAETINVILHSDPIQRITVGADAKVEKTHISNELGQGTQTIEGGDRATFSDISMNIGPKREQGR